MIVAVKKNDFEEVEKCLKKKADINFECKSMIIAKKLIRKKNGIRLFGPAALGILNWSNCFFLRELLSSI